ncbi:MAG: efflux transporter outer membrane subunit [Bryobacterales bacterium]|nr:efflux transporter outer membrane subunit [Bryobacterales bacterium]
MRVPGFILPLTAMLLVGCAIGPNYKRPAVEAPTAHRGTGGAQAAPAGSSLAETPWPSLFNDAEITGLVETALQQNFDIRMAAERIEQARAQYGILRSGLFPTVNASAKFTAQRGSSVGSVIFVKPGTNLDVSYTEVGGLFSWELDLWGRVRRLKEAARAQYLATEDARYGVQTALVADVTFAYLRLRELDLELEIAEKTRKVAEDGLRLTKLRRANGVATGLDVRQAETLLYTATSQRAATERAIEQQENAIQLLLGGSPGTVKRGKALGEIAGPQSIPAGLPSSLLERRPDIRQAEQQLISANAQIGVAKAQYFPRISLSSFVGGQSRSLSSLFTGPARSWNFSPGATAPIFDAGRIRNDVRYSEAVQREAELNYQKTVQNAFREVSDSLIAHGRLQEQRKQQELLVEALNESARLSNARYRGGLDSFLQVLDAQRNLFSGELVLAQLQLAELNSVVQLYRALGGGWQ